ncbi:hypothetical protein BVX95_02210 [archaeon D22]|nr:hypothetical protein BVX95_02210 [archaeon D22]
MNTSEQTINYIKEHPHISHCLKKGLINYSALSRLISEELKLTNKTSLDAILIAARRYQEQLTKEKSYEKDAIKLLKKAELEINNKITIIIFEKNGEDIETVKKDTKGIFHFIEGSECDMIITQERNEEKIKSKLKKIVKINNNLALLNLQTPNTIEDTPGVVSYLTSKFSENGVNIVEFLSCWTDNMFAIKEEDLEKAIRFLRF